MMRSLWSGVSGLQAHQVAMDVEGNNIANVNTTGYKYSRVSFADQMSQTSKTATGPAGTKGGTNAMQVGLGSTTQTATKVFTSGSIENTSVPTDIAINGDGFFVTSIDGGKTYAYTRNGEFKFDGAGNLVNNSGYIVQGWARDENTNQVDVTAPIQNIKIDPAMTIEAKATSTVTVKANLDSGNDIGIHKSVISSLDSFHNAYDKNENGTTITSAAGVTPITYESDEEHSEDSTTDYKFDASGNIIERGVDAGVLFDSNGDAISLRENQGIWVSYKDAQYSATITDTSATNYDFVLNGENITVSTSATSAEENATQLVSAINAYTNTTGVTATANGAAITLTNDNNIGTSANSKNIHLSGTVPGGMAATTVETARYYQYTDSIPNPDPGAATNTARTFTSTEDLRYAMQTDAEYIINNVNRDSTKYPNNATVAVTVNNKGQFQIQKTSASDTSPGLDISITGYSDSTTDPAIAENSSFTSIMKAMNGVITEDNAYRTSQELNVASHSSSIEVFDSLGSRHTLTIDYTKARSSDTGTEWAIKVSVAEPGEINDTGTGPKNIVTGYVRFDDSGALSTYSPYNITYTPNNGAAAKQNIKLDFGQVGGYDGLHSYDDDSSTGDMNRDGYPGGDLKDKEIDQAGNIIGKFTNDESLILGKISLAKFSNNEGLQSEGGNMFTSTANSGEPIVGAADTSGRGSISSSSLEMSNVDLSRSLTQLIVVQRGFQANSKTITTSDEMLNTLLQLK